MSSVVRPPCAAGTFYPATAKDLSAMLSALRRQAEERPGRRVPRRAAAIVLPHAGYPYSGTTAMAGLAAIAENSCKRAVVVGPSHRFAFHGLAFAEYTAYQTPLGLLETDPVDPAWPSTGQERLLGKNTRAHEQEHSIEVLLPMLQYCRSISHILPIVSGFLDCDEARLAAQSLAADFTEESLWVISSDFIHYGRSFDYLPFTTNVSERLRQWNAAAIQKILDMDLNGFQDYIEQTGATICGAAPIKLLLALLEIARVAGRTFEPELIFYTDSAAVTGDVSHVVCYAAIAIYETTGDQ